MFGYFENKSFNEINARDIEQVIESNERECQFLDYKRGESNPDDVISDICAFANAQGGYIIIGISEKSQEDISDGYPESIIGVKDRLRFDHGEDFLLL